MQKYNQDGKPLLRIGQRSPLHTFDATSLDSSGSSVFVLERGGLKTSNDYVSTWWEIAQYDTATGALVSRFPSGFIPSCLLAAYDSVYVCNAPAALIKLVRVA